MNRQVLGLVFVLAVGLAAGAWFWLQPDPAASAEANRQLATWGLADYLAQRFPGERAVVAGNPFVREAGVAPEIAAAERAGVEGLRNGFGRSVTLAAVVPAELRPEARSDPRSLLGDLDTTTPLSYLVATNAFDELARAHPDCQLLISLIGLPADLAVCGSWTNPDPPRWALLLPDFRVAGSREVVVRALKTGKLAAAVLRKPGGPGDDQAPGKDRRSEFERRFVLLTGETVERLSADFPHLLGD